MTETLEANQKYIDKSQSYLQHLLFTVNRDELYNNVNKLLQKFLELIKAVESTNLEPLTKQELRVVIKHHFIIKAKEHTDFAKHQYLLGTLIALFKAIHRHYNILNRTEDEINRQI